MSLLTKLRFKTSAPVHVLGDADGVACILLEEGYTILKKLPANGDMPIQQALLFVRDTASLQKDFAALAPQLASGAMLWIAYPKKSGSIKSDLNRDRGWAMVDEWGYVGVSQASLNEDWSGLWFKKPEALRSFKRGIPIEERKTEGVDYKARTVALPADAANALDAVPGLKNFFHSFSFSHQREWAEAIAEAKKPETRARRIAKMVDDLNKQREAKAVKAVAKQ